MAITTRICISRLLAGHRNGKIEPIVCMALRFLTPSTSSGSEKAVLWGLCSMGAIYYEPCELSADFSG